MKNLVSCHDCHVRAGQAHERGCDVERCSDCGGQRLQCECLHHDPAFARWTGNWPGALEANALGITLNDIAASADLTCVFFVKPRPKFALRKQRDPMDVCPLRRKSSRIHVGHHYHDREGMPIQCPGWGGKQ